MCMCRGVASFVPVGDAEGYCGLKIVMAVGSILPVNPSVVAGLLGVVGAGHDHAPFGLPRVEGCHMVAVTDGVNLDDLAPSERGTE